MCMACTTNLNEARMEEFGNRMLETLNHGALALMTSVGHRTGLFDAMSQFEHAATSNDIAEKAGLNERYVREWLGAMVTSGIVEYDATAKAYHLPSEHAALLTRDAAPNNMASIFQFFSMLGTVEDKIVDCFQNGGGVPYAEYRKFQDVMAEDSTQTVVIPLFDHILPLVSDLRSRLEAGIDVVDVGCGQGRALNLMASTFPNSRFVGYEISEEGVQAGRREAEALGLSNVQFELQDASKIDDAEKFDLVFTFDAIHDQARPDLALANIHRMLRPGGVYLMQDIRASSDVSKNVDHPIGPFLYTISTMHCMTVSLAFEGGMGLGTVWGEELAVQMLNEAGFENVEVKQLEHDFQNNYYICRK